MQLSQTHLGLSLSCRLGEVAFKREAAGLETTVTTVSLMSSWVRAAALASEVHA